MRSNPHKHLTAFALALLLGVAGCASGGGGGSATTASSSSTITKAELDALPDMNGLEAIEQLRRRWLQARGGSLTGSSVVLYIGGVRRQSMDDLRIYRTSEIRQMDFLSSNDATTRYGTGHGAGAILVTLVRE